MQEELEGYNEILSSFDAVQIEALKLMSQGHGIAYIGSHLYVEAAREEVRLYGADIASTAFDMAKDLIQGIYGKLETNNPTKIKQIYDNWLKG